MINPEFGQDNNEEYTQQDAMQDWQLAMLGSASMPVSEQLRRFERLGDAIANGTVTTPGAWSPKPGDMIYGLDYPPAETMTSKPALDDAQARLEEVYTFIAAGNHDVLDTIDPYAHILRRMDQEALDYDGEE